MVVKIWLQPDNTLVDRNSEDEHDQILYKIVEKVFILKAVPRKGEKIAVTPYGYIIDDIIYYWDKQLCIDVILVLDN